MKSIVALVVLAFAVQVLGDCYLHNARGSNNRLDEANRDRANANRIFDSQNNNRGGSNVGSVYHYVGSILSLEWTVQHSCGTPHTACEMVIQYMCDPRLRDGTTTNTIPDNRNECYNFDCDTDVRFGRHESYQWYQLCKQTSRNQGLYTANQGLNGNSAIYTRQNPNGDRRGYECPEERDYYPYWRPSPWVDIAVLTDEGRRCAAYQAESQNVKSRWSCVPPAGWVADKLANGQRGFIPITQAACEAITYTPQGSNIPQTGTWTETLPWGVAAPDCRENQPTRDNHHGNTLGGQPAGYNVTVPGDFISEQCALRVRYNISTGETSNWASPFSVQAGDDNRTTSYLPSQNNNQNNPGRFPAKTAIWEQYRLSYADVADCFDNNKNGNQATLTNCREYVFKNNPKPDIFGDSLLPAATVKLQLAINTNQFGRTFQDRTHKFAIRARPAGVTGNIYNVNVIGKRGNIVQTYPGHEYYFKPEQLMIKRGDFVHFQWTGSNTNPDNNAGQGKQGTDRHNVVSQRGPTYYIPAQLYEGPATATQPIGIYAQNTAIPTYGHYARNYPAKVNDANIGFLGFSQQDRETLAILYDKTTGNGQFGGEKSELDDAGTYFDMGPRVVTQNGNYHYMCTRNNNFSNRGQKAVIVVSDTAGAYAHFGFNEAASTVGGTTVWAATGTFNNLQTFSIVESPRDGSSLDSDTAASPLVYVAPAFLKQNGANTDYSFGTVAGQSVSIMISYDAKAGTPWYKPQAYTTKTPQGAWYTVDADFSNGVATIQTTEGGYFAIQNQPNYAALVLIPIAIVIGVAVLAFLFWKFYGAKHCGDRCSSVGSSTITTTKDGPRRANV